jgi:hypothetical protein
VVGLDLILTFIIAGIAVSVLSSILLVGPLVYWLIGRGYSASRVVRGATFLASLLAIPGLLAVALLILKVFRVASLSLYNHESLLGSASNQESYWSRWIEVAKKAEKKAEKKEEEKKK